MGNYFKYPDKRGMIMYTSLYVWETTLTSLNIWETTLKFSDKRERFYTFPECMWKWLFFPVIKGILLSLTFRE